MNHKLAFLFLVVTFGFDVIHAQTPIVVVPAASAAPATTVTTPVASAPSEPSSLSATIKLLQEMKATNAETLKKQEALLQQLDDLQKAAEQMKAFSKRG
jgi:hypothetical protein